MTTLAEGNDTHQALEANVLSDSSEIPEVAVPAVTGFSALASEIHEASAQKPEVMAAIQARTAITGG